MSLESGKTRVIVAGAGPVGLVLAIDLGRRGIPCVLLERDASTAPWPKMDRSNARTMEMFRRMGLAEQVRDLGYPPGIPMDVFICTTLGDKPLAVLEHASVASARQAILNCRDGSMPLEPYQLVSQNKLEPLLKSVAERTPNVDVQYGHALTGIDQSPDEVSVNVTATDGSTQTLRADYLVGTDGGRSTVRKKLGIQLEGDGGLANVVQVIFRSEDLYERIVVGKGRHYIFLDVSESGLVAQGDRKEFTLHSTLPPDSDFERVIKDLIGFDCGFEILHVVPWRHHLLVAERFRDRRVFLAGDSAHLVIPTGGLGMNTGVGDALDLSWKLAGVLSGWGGDHLLDSYEIERRPVALRNREASRWAAQGVAIWRDMVRGQVESGEPMPADIVQEVAELHNRMHIMRGVELGYSYAGSPVIATEPGGLVEWDTVTYVPNARPGDRIPHMWVSDGRALQDLLGPDWTLLDLRGGGSDILGDLATLVDAFKELGAPIDVLRLDEPDLARAYQSSLLLLRPDLHVAWRGDSPPTDAPDLALRTCGHEFDHEQGVISS